MGGGLEGVARSAQPAAARRVVRVETEVDELAARVWVVVSDAALSQMAEHADRIAIEH